MSEHNHTGLDEAASVASNTMRRQYGLARPFPPRQRALRQADPMELP